VRLVTNQMAALKHILTNGLHALISQEFGIRS
jgi:hypothetical protein